MRLRAGSNILEPLRYKIAKNELEAKFCLPFLMSSIILRRKAGMREFTDEFVASEPVQQMMPRVTGVFDPKIEAQGFDKIRSIVEVDLVDGRTLVQPSDDRYRGGPDRPFTREELHAKFADCAQLVLSADRIQQALTQMETVETVRDVRQLVKTDQPRTDGAERGWRSMFGSPPLWTSHRCSFSRGPRFPGRCGFRLRFRARRFGLSDRRVEPYASRSQSVIGASTSSRCLI